MYVHNFSFFITRKFFGVINYISLILFFRIQDTLGKKLSDAWEKELEVKRKKKKTPSLFKVMWSVFGWNFGILGFVLFIIEMGFR